MKLIATSAFLLTSLSSCWNSPPPAIAEVPSRPELTRSAICRAIAAEVLLADEDLLSYSEKIKIISRCNRWAKREEL